MADNADIDPSTAPETTHVNNAKGASKRYHFTDGTSTTGRTRAVAHIRSMRQGCGCECNSGGFCGGCGHAGCGGRR